MYIYKDASKAISMFGVFVVKSVWAIFAYIWLYIIITFTSPESVDIWEVRTTTMKILTLMSIIIYFIV